MIYHMLPKVTWRKQDKTQPYVCDTLETEGFIHCTKELDRLVWVANHFYPSEVGDFVVLYIDEAQVEAEIKWEEADDHFFPHIYGPLNCNSVMATVKFPRDSKGTFIAPQEWVV